MRTANIIKRTIAACVLIELLFCATRTWAATPGITIETPQPGAIVRPGQTVRVRVTVDPSLLQMSVVEIEPYVLHTGGIGLFMVAAELTSPPYETDITIPNESTGPIQIEVGGRDANNQWIDEIETIIYAIPEEAPTSLEVEASNLFHLQKSPTDPVDTETLRVAGNYADGTHRNITGSLFGTTYTSSDPSVATVDAEGVITPASPGYAYITVEHKGLKVFSEAQVDPLTGLLPPVDQTSKVNIHAGGFRLDREKGTYVQQVTIANMSNLPLPAPLHLILRDLPNGVRLYQSNSATKNIAPLGSPWIFVDVDPLRFMPPGYSHTVNIEFVNMTGIPISYTPKVYTTSHP